MESASNVFHLSVIGQIDFAEFPIGPDTSQVFIQYDLYAGQDWELLSGVKSGITQCSTSQKNYNKVTFNMPIEFVYKATNPFGWPRIVFSIYGKNLWGVEISLGYCQAACPLPGMGLKKIKAPILIPKNTHMISEAVNWIMKKNPELKDPGVLIEGNKIKGLLLESYGELIVSLQSISQGTTRLGYDWGQQDV